MFMLTKVDRDCAINTKEWLNQVKKPRSRNVKKFMQTFGQEVRTEASFPNDKIIRLRLDLIKEELSELKEAIDKKDIFSIPLFITIFRPNYIFHCEGKNDVCINQVRRVK